ncbi:hypothetical protein LWT57_03885 [Enterobacter cloacae]|uniref:hypothetical protein n=1 Tax=Enterobacter cloacae TaxID=550 RepID=UPI001E492FA6|nr:hypothetical protein [Enterobacter cloacae]MCE1969150.1 hypothetical protein [Enterobacter cloacae]
MRYFIFLFCILTNISLACDNTLLDINIAEDFSAKILLKDNDLLSISILNHGKIASIQKIDVSSEKKNHLAFEDYNRDGYKDLNVWHLDEGMGTYKIHRLFIFSLHEGKFKEIKPRCGDDFVNIRIDGDNLINTFYDDNASKSCAMPIEALK